MSGFWREVSQGVFAHTFEPFSVNSYAITGPGGVVVVDSGNSPAQGQLLFDESVTLAARLSVGTGSSGYPILALINTHAHYDHCFGNSAFQDRGIPVIAHRLFTDHLNDNARTELADYRQGILLEGIRPGLWDEVRISPPDIVVAAPTSATNIPALARLGRDLTLIPAERAHTTCDLVVKLPDNDTWLTGDLIETSGPPSIEPDSDTTGWARTLDHLLEQSGPSAQFLPGHGAPANAAQVREQRTTIAAL